MKETRVKPEAAKRLIINADDFGFTRDVNAGIVEAHINGVLTATTLMANGNAFEDAVRLAHEHPTLDVGCHLVLVQGCSLASGRPLPRKLSGVVMGLMAGTLDPYREFRAQTEKIVAAGIRPSHVDTHKHTHILPRVFKAAVRVASEFGVPVIRVPVPAGNGAIRKFYRALACQHGVCMTDHFTGFRLTGALTEGSFQSALERLGEGVTEFMCHPGLLGAELLKANTRLKESRAIELTALTSPRIRETLRKNQIELCSFRDLFPVRAS